MMQINRHRLNTLINGMSDVRIAVIGDLMLDQYFWGRVDRISYEAPVPVVDIYQEEFKPGGAANVALNLKSLFIKTDVYGVVGKDIYAQKLIDEFEKIEINTEGIVQDEARPTTVKTRIIASEQHVARYDKESKQQIALSSENKLFETLERNIENYSAIILEDYNKGVLSPSLIKKIIELANSKNVIIAVDPKFQNYEAYSNATIFKPNLREAEDILKRKIKTDADLEEAGNTLLDLLKVKYLLITLSDKGMALFRASKNMKRIPTQAIKIANVSGAGDTVIAALTAALAVKAQIEEACTIANYAASVVVENPSIIPITRDALFSRLLESGVVING